MLPWLALLSGCSLEDRLHGTWTLERVFTHQSDAGSTELTYPATQADECIAMYGYTPEECRSWYDDIIEKQLYYGFDAVTGQVSIVERSCNEGLCGDASAVVPFATYKVEGVRHVSVGSNYGGRGFEVRFEAGQLRLRDVQLNCNSYYYDTASTCRSTVVDNQFSK